MALDRTTVSRQVNMMIRAVLHEDFWPNDDDVCRMFLLDRCSGAEEANFLLGVYIGMFKLHPRWFKEGMIDAIMIGKLAQYIADLHQPPMQSFYSKWFVSNVARFKY